MFVDATGPAYCRYLIFSRKARYLKNPWGNSKHCLSQFSSPRLGASSRMNGAGNRASLKEFKQRLSQAKGYDEFADITTRGEDVFKEVQRVLEQRSVS